MMVHTSLQVKPLSNIELAFFSNQLALILTSGISSLEGISIMLNDAASPEETVLLQSIYDDLAKTGSLCEAFTAAKVFPAYMIHMVKIGEETGTLDEVMGALSQHYSREDAMAQSIKSAIAYPMIIVSMMVVVILVLLTKVLPMFNQVFIQLGSEMSGFSGFLMNIGTVINQYALVFVMLLVCIVLGFFFVSRTARGRNALKKICMHIPAIRCYTKDMASCRFASGMALTLKSGMNPERCMELVCALNEDALFAQALSECQNLLLQGEDLTDALRNTQIFTGMYARMASVGAKTGALDTVMEQIAGLYQEDLDTRIHRTLSALELVLVISLSLIVGIILLSVMLPLVGIMSSI